MTEIRFKLNGIERVTSASPSQNALHLLKKLGINSIKDGCNGEGTCGICTILLDGKAVNSCHLPAILLDGCDVKTAEHLNKPQGLHLLQQAFMDSGIVQCGYCTSAMLLAACELLEAHPEPSREQIKDYFSGIICRCTGYEQIFNAIDMASKRMKGDADYSVKVEEFRDDLRFVGKTSRKIDGATLLRSDPAFVEDFVRPDALHMKMLWSPYAHAEVVSVDKTEALKIPGVVDIATYEDVPDILYTSAGQNYPEPSPYDQRLIPKIVKFAGDRVAAVVAETEEAAKAAVAAIKVQYRELPALLSISEASSENAPRIFKDDDVEYCFPIGQDLSRNLAASNSGGIGDIDKGFNEADVVLERTYKSGHIQCTPLEPHLCHSYMEGDRLIIHASTQVPFHLRRIAAKVLGINESRIRVIKTRVGGGFGSKQDVVLEELCAFMTWKTGRPVYWRYNRQEEFISSRTRFPTEVTVKVGAKKDGTLTAASMYLQADSGPYGVHCLTVPMNACSKALPLLKCPNMQFAVDVYYTNNITSGAYQGYGAPAGSFAMQMALYELSKELNMSHMELIRKNHVKKGDRLDILKVLGEGQEGIPQSVTSSGMGECLDRGEKSLNMGEKECTDDPYVKIGKGFAIIQQGSGLPGIDSANAVVRLERDGTIVVLQGGADLGTGMDTAVAKVVAEVLCLDLNRIAVLTGDTDATPFDVGAYASSGTYFSATAAHRAALDLRKLIFDLAAAENGVEKSSMTMEYPGIIKWPGGSSTLVDIAAESHAGHGDGQLIGRGHFTVDQMPIPYGAHFAKVAVNTRTGQVKLLAYHAYQDCGTPINPELALGQIYGGVLKSIGHSLYEELIHDEKGRTLNPGFADYKVPMMLDLPEDFKAETVYVEDALGAYGSKSISEIATNGAAPAIASAIHDAAGIYIRDYPFTAEKVLKALKSNG